MRTTSQLCFHRHCVYVRPGSRALSETLTGLHVVKKSPSLYGVRRFWDIAQRPLLAAQYPRRTQFSAASLRKPEITNVKVHYHIRQQPPLVPIVSLIFPGHASPSHFLKANFNSIFPSTPVSSSWGVSGIRFKNPSSTSVVSHTCHMPRTSSSLFEHPNICGTTLRVSFVPKCFVG